MDPALAVLAGSEVSVIVTAQDSQVAATAVTRLGGEVTSELWLIHAVAAQISAAQLDTLAAQPGIVSVVANRGVESSSGPNCDPAQVYARESCAGERSGWMTERREKKGQFELEVDQKAPLVALPDGDFVAVGEKNQVTYFNADGTVRFQTANLGYKNMRTAPLVGPDGSIYFMGESTQDSSMIIFALDPDGNVRWQYGSKDFALGGLAIDFTRGYVYGALREVGLYVLDLNNGGKLAELKPVGKNPGQVILAPIVDSAGVVYLQTERNLFALDPQMFLANSANYQWRFVAKVDGQDFTLNYAPVITANRVYATAGEGKKVFVIDRATGALQYGFATNNKIKAQPVAGVDEALYIPTGDGLYALNPDGATRFIFQQPNEKFDLSIMPSADGSIIYAASNKTLYALDAVTGAIRWQFMPGGAIESRPEIDVQGNIVLGNTEKFIFILKPDGRVTTRLHLNNNFVQAVVSASTNASLLVQVGSRTLWRIGNLPDVWDGRPDVEPTDVTREWQLSNPISVDMGADVLHETRLPDGSNIMGQGVTVALVDSGVYFSDQVKKILGSDLDAQFLGQADFTRGGICLDGGVQYDTYCFTRKEHSQDPYGHGSHVAGIMWSKITDYATGSMMGIAPSANLLSVHVLDERGTGTYEDVIQGIQYVVANKL
ncbi:MAG: PQQ-binding-like beta-propeller repeat protein [Caldilineaceae bacterium]